MTPPWREDAAPNSVRSQLGYSTPCRVIFGQGRVKSESTRHAKHLSQFSQMPCYWLASPALPTDQMF